MQRISARFELDEVYRGVWADACAQDRRTKDAQYLLDGESGPKLVPAEFI